MALELFKPAPLPSPPEEYDPAYINQFIRVLEIYFSQLESLTPNQAKSYRADDFYGSGFYLTTPGAEFSSATTQTAASTTASYPVAFTTSLYVNDVSLASGSRLTFAKAGVYSLEYALQVESPTSTTSEDVRVWLRKNGSTHIPLTAKQFGIPPRKGVGAPSFGVLAAQVLVTVAAADYLEIMWAVSATSLALTTYAAAVSPTVPTTPSAVVRVSFVQAV